MTTGVLSRARTHVSEPLTRGAYSLMVNTVLVSALGVVFWIAAARLYPSAEVGRDSTLITATLALAGICQLNLSNAVTRFLPQVADPARVLGVAYLASAAVALCAGSAFVLVVPRVVDELRILTDEPLIGVGFVVSTALWCVFCIQDAALASMRRAPWVPVENGVYAVLKLAALPLLLALGAYHGIFQSWILPLVLVIVPVNVFLFRVVIPAHRRDHVVIASPLRDGRRTLVGFLATDYAATVFACICWTTLPLLVLALVGSSESAYFYVAFVIVQSLELMAMGAGMSVQVESAFAEERIIAHVRSMARRLLPIVLAGAVVVVAGAPLLLAPFGGDYVDGGSTLLRLLGGAVAFRCAIVLFHVIERARRRGSLMLACDAASAILVVGLAAGLAPGLGLTGVGIAWLVGNGVVAIAILPSLLAVIRERPGRGRSGA